MNKAEAVASLKALLAEHPFGSASFKDKLHEYEALSRQVFGHLETGDKPSTTETKND